MTNLARQFWTLLRMNLAGIPARLGLVSTIIIGVTCAVAQQMEHRVE